jgi:putative ABC transport system permease protein
LNRDPGFSLLAIVTLALGIGLNAGVFSIVDALFLRRLPYPAPDQLVSVQLSSSGGTNTRSLERVRERIRGAMDLAAWSGWSFTLTGEGEPEKLRGAAVTTNFFDLVGVQPQLGRSLRAEDRVPGQRVAVLSHGLWQRRFAADASIIGRAIMLGGQAIPVVGVMPAGYAFPARDVQIWLPIVYERGQAPDGFSTDWVGRLAAGVGVERATAALRSAVEQTRADFPELGPTFGNEPRVLSLRAGLVGQFRTAALILFAAVSFVLLIACVNVANLLLTRATGRAQEIAVRAALGAGRMRIVRQLLTESLLLALIAALVGALIAHFGVRAVIAWLPAEAVNFASISVDWRVLGYALLLALATVLLFGVAPVLGLPLDRAFEALRAAGRGNTATAGRRNALRVLVAAEIALSVILGVGALSMLRSFRNLRTEPPGFEEANVLTMHVALPLARFPTRAEQRLFTRTLLERVTELPGVVAAGEIQILPLGGGNWNPVLFVESRPVASPLDAPQVDWRAVTPGFFPTLRVPLLRGRLFNERDLADAPGVAIVNQTLARRVFGNDNPVGQRVWTAFEGENKWVEIVGVVGDIKDQSLAGDARPQIYRPHEQIPINPMVLLVRTATSPVALAPAIQRAIWSIDKDVAISDVQTLSHVIGNSVAQPRLLTTLLTVFSALAVLFGVVGLVGVIGYSVDRRRQEFGIRAALGAQPAQLLSMVLSDSALTVSVGAAAGLLGAVLLSGSIAAQLYEVRPLDPLTLASVTVGIMLIALLATLNPARRAARSNQLALIRE